MHAGSIYRAFRRQCGRQHGTRGDEEATLTVAKGAGEKMNHRTRGATLVTALLTVLAYGVTVVAATLMLLWMLVLPAHGAAP